MILKHGSDTLTLPNPIFGNAMNMDTNAVVRTNRAGDNIVFSVWPTLRTQRWSFVGLRKTQADALKIFLDDHMGEEIEVNDHNDHDWEGYIMTPDPEFITIKDTCHYDVTLEFLGEQLGS